MEQKRHLSTADLARSGDEMRGRGDEQVTSRSARDAAETFIRNDVGAPSAGDDVAGRTAAENQRMGTADVVRHDSQSRPMLFPNDDAERLRTQWSDIQGTFVDDPRQAVEQADALVADAMKRLATTFAAERANLEQQWDRGGDVTTEDLRVTLQRYRAFFDRLLSV
jgi:hypothetical protein